MWRGGSMKERFRQWLRGRNIAVIGLGISGEGVLATLRKLGAEAFVFDRKEPNRLEYGTYVPLSDADRFPVDLAVISPGVPLNSEEARYFLSRSVPLIGEIEFAFRLAVADYVCITGTNGKTTVTSLCGEIFAAHTKSAVVGNIGIAAAPETLGDYSVFVAEISSFQIETLRDFRAKICAVLNITPDHLDRHGDMETYIGLKLDLLARAEIKVVNADCPVLSERVSRSGFDRLGFGSLDSGSRQPVSTVQPEVVSDASCFDRPDLYRFSVKEKQKRGAYVEDGKIYVSGVSASVGAGVGAGVDKIERGSEVGSIGANRCDASAGSSQRADSQTFGDPEYICDLSDIHLMGSHNIENVLAAVLVSRLYGIPADLIRRAVAAFRAVEHRIEYVDTVDEIRFYNDSKGTNPDSTIKAIEAMDAPCHLIAGGYEKNSDFTEMLCIGKEKISSLSLIGVTAERIRKRAIELGYPSENIRICDDMMSAVSSAFRAASGGEIVLLSPASASWGMYKNFEERGRDFKRCVMNIRDGKQN